MYRLREKETMREQVLRMYNKDDNRWCHGYWHYRDNSGRKIATEVTTTVAAAAASTASDGSQNSSNRSDSKQPKITMAK